MAISKIIVTNEDGTTQEFVQKVDAVVPPTVTIPLGTPVVLAAQTPAA